MILGRMLVIRHPLPALVLACVAGLVAPARAADEPTQELTLHFTHVEAKVLATSLRTIAEIKELKVADDHTIVVEDTAAKLAVAEAVARMADVDGAPPDERFDVGNGTVILRVTLENARAVDVMKALMQQLRLARQATLGEKMLFLRDTDEQIKRAVELINELDSPASH
jgi:hypothetical protein